MYLAVGLVCIHLAPEASVGIGTHALPVGTTCLRATRHTNYATVDIAVGSPPSLLNVMLRLDTVKASNATALRHIAVPTAATRDAPPRNIATYLWP